MDKLGAVVGYTQSDEMTILLPPRRLNIAHQPVEHPMQGRVLKLCSQVASEVTAIFNYRILELARHKGLSWGVRDLPTFDARLGSFDSADEAMMLILWRAYDCSVNGVSDAVHHTGQLGQHIKVKHTAAKLQWLKDNGLLPLDR